MRIRQNDIISLTNAAMEASNAARAARPFHGRDFYDPGAPEALGRAEARAEAAWAAVRAAERDIASQRAEFFGMCNRLTLVSEGGPLALRCNDYADQVRWSPLLLTESERDAFVTRILLLDEEEQKRYKAFHATCGFGVDWVVRNGGIASMRKAYDAVVEIRARAAAIADEAKSLARARAEEKAKADAAKDSSEPRKVYLLWSWTPDEWELLHLFPEGAEPAGYFAGDPEEGGFFVARLRDGTLRVVDGNYAGFDFIGTVKRGYVALPRGLAAL